jgi:hypothetical protein
VLLEKQLVQSEVLLRVAGVDQIYFAIENLGEKDQIRGRQLCLCLLLSLCVSKERRRGGEREGERD